MDAILIPFRCNERTVDSLVDEALRLGMVPCNSKTGPFRIAFFNPGHIPAGWAKFSFGIKESAPCAA